MMSSDSPRLRLLGRAVLFVSVAVGLVWLANLQMPGEGAGAPNVTTLTTTGSTGARATSPPRTAPKLGTPKGKTLRTAEGEAHPFIERSYQPAHRLPLLDAPVAPTALSSPEEVVTSLASAIRQLDWQWFLGLWDPASRTYMVEAMEQAKFVPARRLAQWRRNYVGKEMQITRRIDMGGYALISIQPTDAVMETWSKVPPLATKRDASGRWWLTHDLRAHPVQAMDMGLASVTITDRGAGP